MSGIGVYEVHVVVTESINNRTYLMRFKSRKELTHADIRKYFCTFYHDGTYDYKILDPVYEVHDINFDSAFD